MVNEIAFSSPAFKTEGGVSLSNFRNQKSKFSLQKSPNDPLTLQGGGFKIVEAPPGTPLPIGIVYPAGSSQSNSWWLAEASPQRRIASTTHGATERKSAQDDAPSAKAVVQDTAVAINKSAPTQDIDTMITPGVKLGKICLGASRDQVLALLGKPGDVQGSHLTYMTKDRKTFLTISLENDLVSEIIFSSKIFSSSGITVSNFESPAFASLLMPSKPLGNAKIYSLKQGGLSFVKRLDGKTFGWLYSKEVQPAALPWTPLGP